MNESPPDFRVLLVAAMVLATTFVGCRSTDEELPAPPSRPAPSRESTTVRFDISAPAETPCGASVAVTGNHEALGHWQLPGLPLVRDVDGHFRGSVELPVGATITYNLLLTGPEAQEIDASGRLVDVRAFTVEDADTVEVRQTVSRWSLPANASNPPTHFVVEVPANTPATAEVWLSGNQPELGNWNGAGVMLAKSPSDNRFRGCISFAIGTNLEFKVTRGSWDSVEKDPQGQEIDNHLHFVNGPAQVSVHVGSWRDLGPVNPQPDTLTGTIRYHEVDGSSVGLKNRRIIVWLPSGYDAQESRHYPVLYMHDGQNLMNARTAFVNVEWGVDETAQRLVEAGQMEPIIIVGVYNTDDRIPEYTPVPTPPYGGGRAEDYSQLLVEVIKPLIDSTYRTKPEAQYTGVAGSSLGGLVSMYFGLTRSSTFTRIGVVSPSVWWANGDIISRVNELSGKLPLRIWLDIGTHEDSTSAESQQTVDDTRALRDALSAKGWELDADLKYLEAEGARHNEAAWAARTEQILRFLYPPQP